MAQLVWLNGAFVQADAPLISHRDNGFALGLGVFDTMLANKGQPVYAQAHFRRLVHDCKTVLLHNPDLNFDWFVNTAQALLVKNKLSKGYARIRTQITAGVTSEMFGKPESPLVIMSVALVKNTEPPPPIHAYIIEDYPRIAHCAFENCKRMDYTRSYGAKQKAIALGGHEAILTNTEGNIACATTSNLFIIETGNYITPPLSDGVLDGITRKKVIEKYSALEESITIERLLNADEVFLTNSIRGVNPVQVINDKTFSGTRR